MRLAATLADASSLLSALADPVRLRLVVLLARHELSVVEVQEALGIAQSRASSHLALLRDAGLVRARRDGRNALYSAEVDAMPTHVRAVWDALAKGLDDRLLDSDARRAAALVGRRRGARSAWAESVAGEMERHYSPGRTWEATARGLLGLTRHGDVLDAGSGDGTLAALLAPLCRSVTLLDASERLIDAAKKRLRGASSVRFEVGDVAAMPFRDASFDVVMLFNVLTCLERPDRALAEAARVLRPGGRLAVVTLAAHEHLPVAARYGHVRAGFRPAELSSLLRGAGLSVESVDITSRERREPFFEVLTAFATRAAARKSTPPRRPSSPPSRKTGARP
ncbi:MAG: metalloregulator ArsR/SmtB family transcription factor [Sandaracinaceae bacterium]